MTKSAVKKYAVHVYEVQVRSVRNHEAYQSRYTFRSPGVHNSQAWLYYSSINTGPGYAKRLVRDGKVIARQFG